MLTTSGAISIAHDTILAAIDDYQYADSSDELQELLARAVAWSHVLTALTLEARA